MRFGLGLGLSSAASPPASSPEPLVIVPNLAGGVNGSVTDNGDGTYLSEGLIADRNTSYSATTDGDFRAEFEINTLGGIQTFGVSYDPSTAGEAGVDFGFKVYSAGETYRWQNSALGFANRVLPDTVQGDVFAIEVSGGDLTFYRNDTELWAATAFTPSGPLGFLHYTTTLGGKIKGSILA